MVVCLVIPPSSFLLDERVFMPLGVLKVAAALEHAGHDVEMVDLSGVSRFEDAISRHASASQASVFGLTATTPQLPAAVVACRAIRAARPDARVILGGPHVTLVNTARKREARLGTPGRATRAYQHIEDEFDALVAGDGELAIFRALRRDAPKLIDADEPGSSLFLTNERLAALPLPARHLLDMTSYHYAIEGARATSLIAQLGCPFACGFCCGRESPSLRRVRSRPAEQIVQEIRELHRTWGFTGFMFYDDELNVNPGMHAFIGSIERLQRELNVEFRLRGFIKAELFDDAQAEAMRRAGFHWILVGFESGSPRILRNINKKATREDNTRCVEIARRHGIKVKALMSIGHPGETNATVLETRDWLLEVAPADFDVTLITAYPGSPYYDHALPHPGESGTWTYEYRGDRLHSLEIDHTKVADYFKGNPDGGYRSFVYTDFLSPDELVGLRDHVERHARARLNIPFPAAGPGIEYEHSMGQGGPRLPARLLRTTLEHAPVVEPAMEREETAGR